jgi:hypothetical protein
MRVFLAALRTRGLLTSQITLVLSVLVAYAAVCVPARLMSGPWGFAAAAVVAASCWGGAAAGLAASRVLARGGAGLAGLLVGMGLRMGIPLVFVVVLHLSGGPLVEAGMEYYFLVFYPLTLAVGTALSLPLPATAGPLADPPRKRAP